MLRSSRKIHNRQALAKNQIDDFVDLFPIEKQVRTYLGKAFYPVSIPRLHFSQLQENRPIDLAALPSLNQILDRFHFSTPDEAAAECVNLFETTFGKECYAAAGSGGLMKTVGARAGGSGLPFTKRDGLRAYAA